MQKEVLIHVRGLQMMDAQGDQEPIEIIVPGQYYFGWAGCILSGQLRERNQRRLQKNLHGRKDKRYNLFLVQ